MPDRRGLPAVHRVLDEPRIARFVALLGPDAVKAEIGAVLSDARSAGETPSADTVVARVAAALGERAREGLVGVLNATGILLHTNLGRAPLPREAVDAIAEACAGASNLEFDLAQGTRGSRYDRVRALLHDATGAEDALVVNNCAAAVLLVLDTFARGVDGAPREVVVARSELIEIGGGFRLPDVLARSGARMIEVGTTNKVRVEDYARALSPHTALLLRAHASNYRVEGFVEQVSAAELAALGGRTGVPVVEDLGSGALCDLREYGLPRERTVQDALRDGLDLVAFSGDKLLGGPQAGIVVGGRAAVARLRANPLLRALRVGGATLAALAATLRLHLASGGRERIPFYAMLAQTPERLRERAAALSALLEDETFAVTDSVAYAGGGTLPLNEIPSVALAWTTARGQAESVAVRLRRGTTPVVARVEDERVLFDLRTIPPDRDADLAAAVRAARDAAS